MARPRKVSLPSGTEVIIKNASVDEANKIKAAILNEAETEVAPAEEQTEEEVASEELTHIALGMYEDKETNSWYVAEISYSPITGEGRITKRHNEGRHAVFATDRFKVLVGQKVFV